MVVRIALMGGGTAGHLFPSVAVAQRLVADWGAQVLFIGAQGRLDGRILASEGLPHELIPARQFPYGLSVHLVPAVWTLYRGYRRCLRILGDFRPDAVFGAGGYVSVAGVLAAWRLHIPAVCHVSDALPDRANRLLGRFATRLTVHYQVAVQHLSAAKTTVTGQPVRREFLTVSRSEARAALGLPAEAFVLLVLGGSQGARALNEATLAALDGLLALEDLYVVHLTGAREHESVVQRLTLTPEQAARYQCLAYHEQPWLPAAAADLALTRGGASSLAELAVLGLPMLIVPYPHAAGHQRLNAAPLVAAGAARMVDNSDLTGEWLLTQVRELYADRAVLETMSRSARHVSRPEAAAAIASLLVQIAGRPRSAASVVTADSAGGR